MAQVREHRKAQTSGAERTPPARYLHYLRFPVFSSALRGSQHLPEATMIHITVFNKGLQPQFSASLAQPQDAAATALNLSASYPFVRVRNDEGDVLFSAKCGVSKERLVHAIQTRAKVEFKGR
jgi:hypothetical protein